MFLDDFTFVWNKPWRHLLGNHRPGLRSVIHLFTTVISKLNVFYVPVRCIQIVSVQMTCLSIVVIV